MRVIVEVVVEILLGCMLYVTLTYVNMIEGSLRAIH